MKRTIVALLLLSAAPVLAVAQEKLASDAGSATPSIQIADKIKDFGEVPKGQKLEAVFTIKNTGTAPLEISQVRPTCGCTVADFDRSIPPGGTGSVKATVDTEAFSGPQAKAVLVFSNDPENPQVNLVIKFDSKAFIEVHPRPLLWFNALQGEEATEKVTLTSYDGSPFKITGVDAADTPFKVSYRELPAGEGVPDAKGPQWEVAVTIPADAPEGNITGKIMVKTTSSKAPEVALNARATIRPIIQVLPSAEVDFGTITSDAPIGRNLIVINNRQASTLELTDPQVDDPAFTAEIVPLQAGLRFQVAITIKPGTSKGEHKATLKIKTSDPARPVLELPLKVVVQ